MASSHRTRGRPPGEAGDAGKRRVLIARTASVFGVAAAAAEALLSQPRRQSVRLNPLAGRPADAIAQDLAAFADGLIPIPWCPVAFHLDLPPDRPLPQALFDQGDLFIQNAASFLPVLALDPQPGERILDLCAAPGGKSSHIAALTGNQAELWLNDGIEPRLAKLREVMALLHVAPHAITAHPGQFIDRFLDGPFDRILIDAQCTGEGMIDLRSRSSYQYWALDRVTKYSMLQRKMLMAAHRLLKPGGVIVYSTCTFAPEENEIPVNHLIRHRPDMDLDEIPVAAPELVPARTDWDGQPLDRRLRHARRVRPTPFMEGFFVARLRKRAV